MKLKTAFLFVLLATCGCASRDQRDCASEYGLVRSVLPSKILQQAMDLTNTVAAGSSRPISRTCSGRKDDNCIALALVDGESMARSYPVFTTGACIILSDAWLWSVQGWFSRPEGAGGMEVDASSALALILLHELGHVNDASQTPEEPMVEELSQIFGTERSSAEILADVYAAQQLRRAEQSAPSLSASLEISLTASHISWNLLGKRLLDNFGATTLGLGHVFADSDPSHPNMELRFLVVSYVLNPSDTARQALRDFVARHREPRPSLSYHALALPHGR